MRRIDRGTAGPAPAASSGIFPDPAHANSGIMSGYLNFTRTPVFPRPSRLPALAGLLLAAGPIPAPAAPPPAVPSSPVAESQAPLDGILAGAVSALKQRVESGPPFLLPERRARLDRLEKLLGDPKAEPAEKYRRVVEAYRVELDYAKTMEVYRDLLRTNGEERLVDFLAVGRLALYYQTLDGRESGLWRAGPKQWQRLSGEDNEAISQAIRTARKLEPPQLVPLPLPGPRSP